MIVCHTLAQDTHVNESSYVVKVDASTVGYGNQSRLCMLYKVKWTAEVRERGNNLIYDDLIAVE